MSTENLVSAKSFDVGLYIGRAANKRTSFTFKEPLVELRLERNLRLLSRLKAWNKNKVRHY